MSRPNRRPALRYMGFWRWPSIALVLFAVAVTPIYLDRAGGGGLGQGMPAAIDDTACAATLLVRVRSSGDRELVPRTARHCHDRVVAAHLTMSAEDTDRTSALAADPLEWSVTVPSATWARTGQVILELDLVGGVRTQARWRRHQLDG